jgi:hypothetical protein
MFELEKDSNISFVAYHGVYNDEAKKLYSTLAMIRDDGDLLVVKNSMDGNKIKVGKVRIDLKENDIEYGIKICEIVVDGKIV